VYKPAWEYTYMRTNIEIDDQLMAAALAASGAKTKREVVEAGLRELIRVRTQRKALGLEGKINWVGDLDAMRVD
jgi:Arc/MetJ family transcription regulator